MPHRNTDKEQKMKPLSYASKFLFCIKNDDKRMGEVVMANQKRTNITVQHNDNEQIRFEIEMKSISRTKVMPDVGRWSEENN